MLFFAVTQQTAEWLLPKMRLLDALRGFLAEVAGNYHRFESSDFVEGPIRIALDDTRQVLALVHTDYLQRRGERWGFIKLTGNLSISQHEEILREVLERAIYIVNQRLRGLLIDAAYFHRKHENGAHTVLAGRGTEARRYSLGYVEQTERDPLGDIHALVCVGPHETWSTLSAGAELDGRLLPRLTSIANSFILSQRISRPMSSKAFTPLRTAISYFESKAAASGIFDNVQVTQAEPIAGDQRIRTLGFSYEDWIAEHSPLSDTQRRILESNVLDQHPLRVLGPAGSGKTLLMQLLATRIFKEAKSDDRDVRLMYIVHSEAMRDKVVSRFDTLSEHTATIYSNLAPPFVFVTTLSEYCRKELGLELEAVLDRDAADAKLFQLEQITEAILKQKEKAVTAGSKLLRSIFDRESLLKTFAAMVLVEISVSIKGHGLEGNKRQYVESERNLSRFHGILNQEERSFVFDAFRTYHNEVFEQYGVLDPDDIAISLSGRLRTPVWQLRRRREGFDFVFVDETQLFNENERGVFSLLTRGNTIHVPIALALDEAQSFYSQFSAGFAALGIEEIANETLESIQRSTTAITQLAFFVIQQSIDLFGPEFPEFTKFTNAKGFVEADKHSLASTPRVEFEPTKSHSFAKFVVRMIKDLRKENVRQIAIVCHAEQYWNDLESEFSGSNLPFQVLKERGERLRLDQPLVILCRPAQVGGQEFDAVVIVGLEHGVVPPDIQGNPALAVALEQQSIREMYLSITRARYRVIFAVAKRANPNVLLQGCANAGLVTITP
jgi:hypothetical protein